MVLAFFSHNEAASLIEVALQNEAASWIGAASPIESALTDQGGLMD